MAMTKCPECGHSVSTNASKCPSCGTGLNLKEPDGSDIASGCIVLVFIVAVAVMFILAFFEVGDFSWD
jgi:ABC-type ATPase with predicted acetyltransferase domain